MEDSQIENLNSMARGKTVERIVYNEDGMDYLTIYFTDGTRVILSTLGGIEIVKE